MIQETDKIEEESMPQIIVAKLDKLDRQVTMLNQKMNNFMSKERLNGTQTRLR